MIRLRSLCHPRHARNLLRFGVGVWRIRTYVDSINKTTFTTSSAAVVSPRYTNDAAIGLNRFTSIHKATLRYVKLLKTNLLYKCLLLREDYNLKRFCEYGPCYRGKQYKEKCNMITYVIITNRARY